MVYPGLRFWYSILTAASLAAASSPYQFQTPIVTSTADDWQKYVRSPARQIIYPKSVLSNYTVGNVTNPDGLLTGHGHTILTRADGESSTRWLHHSGHDPCHRR